MARADEVDDTLKKLIDLDQRVHVMALELREAPPPPPDVADRRVLDAQVLYSLKNYEEAATILLDVVEKYPNTRAHDDALVLLGESLFQARDFYSARHYLQEAVAKNTGSKSEQQALQRLVEISLRTGDFDNVDAYLTRLQNLPPNADGAGHAVRARQVLLLPQPARRRGGGVRVDPADQPVLLPGALLPRPPSRSRRATWRARPRATTRS